MNHFLKELPKTFLLAIIIFIVIQLLNITLGYSVQLDKSLLVSFTLTTIYTFSLSYANSGVFCYLDKVFEEDRFSLKRIVIGFLASFVVSLLVIFILRVLEALVFLGKSFEEYLTIEKPANFITAIVITFIITISAYAFHFYKAYTENRVKEQKIIAGTANAKFESLKNQIDPHFLFNSLNVLSSLIEENPENAQRFTTSLSKIYRYVLEQKDKELVSVQEELNFAKTYMNLLKMRFENSIFFEIPEKYENAEAKVVPLSLQLLLENTIKHNIVSEQKPLHIKIFIKDNFLVVQNALQKKENLQDRRGVGLQNIVSRYAILTQRKVVIEETATHFSVYLPILTKQISMLETNLTDNEDKAYFRAKKRVEELKGFYGNLISYCCIVPILIFINLKYSPQFQWFWFSAAGWGFGVLMHAFKTFGYGANWEERKIKEILEKNKQTNTWD
ncbi:histidine kinase [Flavobacterium sp. SUN046]|uniref:histidine kinase n=1 Tax=Flavobacterium sp. SUN046 TaxID=3002440 RepID=UPI002DBC6D84|nr:histidine kinase [Flavobacterium sp. SUN046]MEC4049888.1 histidine kinase [Flavobacterium sp. SUN046]